MDNNKKDIKKHEKELDLIAGAENLNCIIIYEF